MIVDLLLSAVFLYLFYQIEGLKANLRYYMRLCQELKLRIEKENEEWK